MFTTLVPESKMRQLVRAAEAVLMADGEAAPIPNPAMLVEAVA